MGRSTALATCHPRPADAHRQHRVIRSRTARSTDNAPPPPPLAPPTDTATRRCIPLTHSTAYQEQNGTLYGRAKQLDRLMTWSDNDYGRNDGGDDFAYKRQSQVSAFAICYYIWPFSRVVG